MWLLYRGHYGSYPEIGRRFNRDHTSVMHGVAATDQRIARDPTFAAAMQALRQRYED
mgnify:FL=1